MKCIPNPGQPEKWYFHEIHKKIKLDYVYASGGEHHLFALNSEVDD